MSFIPKSLLRPAAQEETSVLEINLVVRPEEEYKDKVWVKIVLHSIRRKGLHTFNYVDADDWDLERKVQAAAGAAAEHQCDMYGDPHDPDAVARHALIGLRKLKERADKINAKVENRIYE
jgi:hypothetical protein